MTRELFSSPRQQAAGAAPSSAIAAPEQLALALRALRSEAAGEELTTLTTAAFHDLAAACDDRLSPAQTAALDRTLLALEQVRALSSELAPSPEQSFTLRRLMDDLTLLCADDARRRGIEIAVLVYDDLPERCDGQPDALRALLYPLFQLALQQQPERLVVRVMAGESAATHDHPNAQAVRFRLSAEGGSACASPSEALSEAPSGSPSESPPSPAPDPQFDSLCAQLQAISGQEPSPAEAWLELPLTPSAAQLPGEYPLPWGGTRVWVSHPVNSVRQSLIHRLRRMRYAPIEAPGSIAELADIGTDADALLLAVAPGDPLSGNTQALQDLSRRLPIVLLSDAATSAPPGAVYPLPRQVDDRRLYRTLVRAIHDQRLQRPLPSRDPDAAATLVGGNADLAADLHNRFVGELQTALTELRALAASGDRQALKDAVHKLKGGAAYCGVPALGHTLARFNECLRNDDPQQVSFFLRRLEHQATMLIKPPDSAD